KSTTAAGIVDALDVSDAEITNGVNFGVNFALFDGIRIFEGTTGTLTIEDTSGNDLITVTDAGTTGNLAVTGTITTGSGNEVITLSTGKIDADAISLVSATNGLTGTSSASGLATYSDKLSL